MSETMMSVQPAPAKAPGAAAPPKDGDGPPNAFAEALGAAQTADSPPSKSEPARTAHAEGTKAEGDSSGRKRKATHAAPEPTTVVVDAPAQTPVPVAPVTQAPAGIVKGGGHGHRLGGRPAPVAAPITSPAVSGKAASPKNVHPASAITATPLGGTADAATAAPAKATAAASAEGAAPAPTAMGNALAAAPGAAVAHDGARPAPKRSAGGRSVKAPAAPVKGAAPAKVAPSRNGRAAAKADPRQGAARTGPAQSQVDGVRNGETATTARTASTPDAQATQPRVRVQELADSMHALVRVANRRGTAAARITLRPVELGGVQVRLRAHEGGVSAQITAETSAGAQALGASHAELRRSLESQGIVVHGIEVQLAGDGLGADSSAHQRESQAAFAQAARFAEDDIEGETTTIEPSLLPDSGTQVDVLA